tara:strand:- start:29 stop:334 length:306 start_codon:yes stop_codon:yes gene_type:complete
MNEQLINPKLIKIQLIIRDDCTLCDQAVKNLTKYCESRDCISLEVINLDLGQNPPQGKQNFIIPAVWVNDKLWSLGILDLNRFNNRMNQLLRETSNLYVVK